MEPSEEPRPGIAAGADYELVALVLAAALFISFFLPWFEIISGWALRVGDEAALLALAVVLVELLRLTGSWVSRGAQLLAFCLTAAAGIMAVSTFVTLRWGTGTNLHFSTFRYGAWLALAFGILLVVLAAVRLASLRRPAP